MKIKNINFMVWIGVVFVLLLSGCGNRYEEQLTQNQKKAQSDLQYLQAQLESRQLTNALLISKYANALTRIKPDYADVASLLKREGTPEGKAFLGLSKRLAEVNLLPKSEKEASISYTELSMIRSAADPVEFNNALADVVNTMASLSDGQLAVIDVPASQVTAAQNTNALVGNPSYGRWQNNSSGTSLWAWYGMYSMFNNVVGGGRYNYNSWSSRPQYGYYNNYGRTRWGSSADVSKNYNLSQKSPSRYNKPNSATKRRYATASSRSSSFGSSGSRSSYSSSKSGSSSRSSSYGSSSRSSSFSSSRSSFSGK